MIAGANFSTPTGVTPTATAGASEIVLSANTGIQTVNGNIDLIAGGSVVTGTGTVAATGGGSILMQAVGANLVLGGKQWTLPDSPAAASLRLESGDNIIFSSSTGDVVSTP